MQSPLEALKRVAAVTKELAIIETEAISVRGPVMSKGAIPGLKVASLYIRIPKTPRTEPGKNDRHDCQRALPAGIAVYVQGRKTFRVAANSVKCRPTFIDFRGAASPSLTFAAEGQNRPFFGRRER